MIRLPILLLVVPALLNPQERIKVDVNQAEQPIRVDVSLVNVAFTVHDSRGVLVPDLKKEDFEILEDGVPQQISFFAHSNDAPLTLGVIVDASGSQEHFVKPHHHDLENFLEQVMEPRDRAFLVCFGNHVRLVSDFSASPAQLVDALKSFEKGNRNFPEFAPEDFREAGTAFYDAIYHSVRERLAHSATGRRVLLIFSDGEDNSSAHHMLDAIESAQSEDVRLYALRYTETRHGRLTARNKYGTRVMDRLALETGGAHYDARERDLKTAFKEIGEELRATYELGYHTTNQNRDGTFRKLVIRPKRDDLKVRAKTGYFARP
jgi:Ca-activated chloride channel homolog